MNLQNVDVEYLRTFFIKVMPKNFRQLKFNDQSETKLSHKSKFNDPIEISLKVQLSFVTKDSKVLNSKIAAHELNNIKQ